jgi:hypothetical protein
MAEDQVKAAIGPSAVDDGKRTYERSTIEFPYNDLDDAVEVAKAVHYKGGGSCTLEQLAAQLDQSPTSGTFRGRVSNAGTFRLTLNASGGTSLSDLGWRIIDPAQEKAARVDSFLAVPLYSSIFEKYKKYLLPPASALEREIIALGVAPKQASKARQAFMRSAEQAGFFEHGKERLVLPSVADMGPGTKPVEPPSDADRKGGSGGGGGDNGGDTEIDPIIRGLLVRLPKSGDVWPEADRKLWLQLLEGSFKLIYKDTPPVN